MGLQTKISEEVGSIFSLDYQKPLPDFLGEDTEFFSMAVRA